MSTSTQTLMQAETRAAWDSIAAGYDEFVTPSHFSLGTQAIRRLGLRPGQRFLDVAAGSGGLCIPAARAGARVLATDVSPLMLARLEARARAEGLPQVETRVMDGHALDLEDDTFDAAGSQFGVMLLPDLPRALGEMVRVTRPGGRVLLVVFGSPREVEFLAFFLAALRTAIPGFTGLPMDPPPLPFQVADPAKLRRALEEAGLTDVRIDGATEEFHFRAGGELWDWLLSSNPIAGELVGDASEQQKEAARRTLEEMVRERAGGGELATLTSPIHIAIGKKPGGA